MENFKIDVVVAGILCLDLTPKFNTKKCSDISEILIPAKTLIIGEMKIHPGGCVANTGLALKMLGANAVLMSKVGNDDLGKMMLEQISEKADISNIDIDNNGTTPYSIVISPSGIDRIFLHHCGVNDDYGFEDIDFDIVKNARIFHFGYPPSMKKIYQNEGEELIRIYKKAHELGVATSLDTTAVDEFSEAGNVNWEKIIKKIALYLDFFVPSVEELCYMLDKEMYKRWRQKAGNKDIVTAIKEEDISILAEKLISFGIKVVLIKCGAKGIYLATAQEKELATIGGGLSENLEGWGGVRHFELSYKPDKLLSATGAGDTCIAAFLYSILKGIPYQEAVQYATATGAFCVETYDSLSGLRSFPEIRKKIEAGWDKNTF